MDFEQLVAYGNIPPSFIKQAHQPYHQRAKHHLSSTELDTLLMQAQKGYDPITDGELICYLNKLISLEATKLTAAGISQYDENKINLISLLFKQIAKNTTQQNADLFIMLSVPYTRLALNSLDFLYDTAHPARQVLDKLMHLSQSADAEQAFHVIRFFTTTVTLRFNHQSHFFSKINSQLQQQLRVVSPTLEVRLHELNKQLDPQKKQQTLNQITKMYVSDKLSPMPQQLSFFVLMHHFLEQVFWQIGKTSKQVVIDWLRADQDISEFLHLFDKRNILSFKDAHTALSDHVKVFNSYLQFIKIPLSLRKIFFEQLQELLNFAIKGADLYSLKNSQLRHSDSLNKEIDHNLQNSPLIQSADTYKLGYENQETFTAFAEPQTADIHSIAKTNINHWLNLTINGQRMPCKIHFYSEQRQSLYLYNQHKQLLFKRSGGDLVIDLQLGYAELLQHCSNVEQAIRAIHHYAKKYSNS